MIALVAVAVGAPIVDATGTSVDGAAAERIVVAGGGLTECVFALGLGDRVVAVDTSSTWPTSVKSLPQIGYWRALGAEGVLSLKPDLVVLPDDAGPAGLVGQLRAVGVKVAVLPHTPSVHGVVERLSLLGALLDRADAAAKATEELERSIAAVERPDHVPSVLFVYGRGAGAMQVAGGDTAAQSIIELSGGRNAVTAWTGYRPMTPEALLLAKPDVILFTDGGLAAAGGVDGVLAVPGVARTPAGATRRVIALDDGLLLGFGPRTGEAAGALAAKLKTP